MPFTKVDEGALQELIEAFGNDSPGGGSAGGFSYQDASASFKEADLSPQSRVLLEAIRRLGASHFRVRYDGGHDEGFSHPEFFRFPNGTLSIEEVVPPLVRSSLASQILALEPEKGRQYIAKWPTDKLIKSAIDDLAGELASRLLGRGYGTGEYELYGAFDADLASGEIVDDKNAQPRIE